MQPGRAMKGSKLRAAGTVGGLRLRLPERPLVPNGGPYPHDHVRVGVQLQATLSWHYKRVKSFFRLLRAHYDYGS
jgi:hypothetical protein